MHTTSIFTDTNEEIPLFDKKYTYFLNKSIILYGSSGSGKSMIMRDILYILKDHIPNIIVIAPTNHLNKSFDDIIPSQLIFPDVTEELIQNIFKRQKTVVKLYNMVNDINKLENIYNKISQLSDNFIKNKIINSYNQIKYKYEQNDELHIVEKKIKLKELEDVHKKSLIEFYKKIINRYRNQIMNNTNIQNKFDDIEFKIIKCININPNFLLILDDCAYNANVWSKYSEIKEIFMNGRHHKITFMISFQDDKLLDSGLRKNAFINIFTTEIVCNAFFQRSANNFTKQEKNRLSKLSSCIFNDPKLKDKNYKKLVYIKDKNPNVYYILADYIENFKFGSEYLHNLCNKVKKKNDTNEENFNLEIDNLLNSI
jgi:energy-coupling factor transporter ATP-binding protein EcfA2